MNDHFRGVRNMINDTPRTDAHNWHDGDYDDPLHAFYDFACILERELNTANQRIKRLEEVGDEIVINYVNSLSAFEMWRKAKEAKP